MAGEWSPEAADAFIEAAVRTFPGSYEVGPEMAMQMSFEEDNT